MKNFYKQTGIVLTFLFILSGSGFKLNASIGDTTIVQTFRFDTTMRAGVFLFPDDTTKTYEKIVMLYSMRCKNGLVSNSNFPNQGCGEWDYNCYTYMVDSSQTDSLRSVQGSYRISNFSDSVFSYTTNPVYAYTSLNQQEIVYTGVISESTATVGSGTTALTDPFNTINTGSRSQYLWTAAELISGGLSAGDLTGLRMDVVTLGTTVYNLRIKFKQTLAASLNENSPETTGFTEVYFLNTPLTATGQTGFNFHTPFTWDGTSNLIAEFSFDNATSGTNSEVQGHDAGFNATLTNIQPDAYLNNGGTFSLLKINPDFFPSVTDQITIAFWSNGDPKKLPANTSFIEGKDANNNRQVNIHLPWSDETIYWDCGNDGTGYDRISKIDTAQDNYRGKWTFWAFTKNASTGTMSIYVNGVLWATGTGKSKLINLKEMVAGMGISNSNYYHGGYDELSIWNKELSSASIQQIMYKEISASHPDYSQLQVYYKLNEGQSNIAYDASPHIYNSEIINPNWRFHRGGSLYRNFSASTFRPNTTFVQGVYTSTTNTFTVLDSVLLNPTSVIAYNLVNVNELNVIDTVFVWPSGYAYIYDVNGIKIDSISVAATNTITVVPLSYYQKRPMRFELINFITPYGLGLTLDGLNGKTWEFDVTDFAPFLKGARFMAMEDGKYQEDNDIKFVFYEGTPPRNVKSISQIWPNASWVSPSYADINANKYFEPRSVVLASDAAQFKIRSAISGHQQNGEFDPHTHSIILNGSTNFTWPLTKECATNPIYPQGGTWVYDRQGWCPGAAVDLKEYDITGNVTPGSTITLDYTIPQVVNGSSNFRVNNQFVSYGPPNFTTDAAIDYIKTPSKRVEFERLTPICNAPVISLKNTGSDTLKSVDITYGRVGGVMSVYQWTGSLAFLKSAEITLPAPDWLSSGTNEFVAVVSNPNSTADQYAGNDTMISAFNIPPSYPSALIFELRTNNYGAQSSYNIKDDQGTIVHSRSGLANNTFYRDTLFLNNTCYTLFLNDAGDDGLSWWANPGQGTGSFRIRNYSNTIIKTFNPDFGDNIYQQFTVNYSLPVAEPVVSSIEMLNIYPNPATDMFTAEFELPVNTQARLKLVNLLGEVLITEHIAVSQQQEKVSIDLKGIENGIYFVVLEAGNSMKTQKIVVAR